MAKLDAAERKRLPSSDYALPEQREYPIEDEEHARLALGRASEFASPEEREKIRAAVKRKYPDMTLSK